MFPALSLSPKPHGTSENSTVLERRNGSRSVPVNSRVIWRSRVEVRRDSPDKYVWQSFHNTKNTLLVFFSLFFPRFFAANKIFFPSFLDEIFFLVDRLSRACRGGVFHNNEKEKNEKIHNTRAREKKKTKK